MDRITLGKTAKRVLALLDREGQLEEIAFQEREQG